MPFNGLIPITSQVVASFNAITALGWLTNLAALSCVLGLLIGLIVAVAYFISLITGHYEISDDA